MNLKKEKAKYDVVRYLKKVPTLLSVHDALMLSNEIRELLIMALQNPEVYMTSVEPDRTLDCMAAIVFSDKDVPKNSEHNQPLYVEGKVANKTVTRIVIDCGSAINLLPLKTLYKLGYMPEQLVPSKLKIHGLNQTDQRALGLIYIDLDVGGLDSPVQFFVIDAATTYKMLLGRPWIHENGGIPSTLYQCFKYMKDGVVRKVEADQNPFPKSEAHCADARYYLKRESKKNKSVSSDKGEDQEFTPSEGEPFRVVIHKK